MFGERSRPDGGSGAIGKWSPQECLNPQVEGAEGADGGRREELLEPRQREMLFQLGWPPVWPKAAENEEGAGETVRAQTTEDHQPAQGSGAQHPQQVLAAVGKPGVGKSHN